MTRKQQSKHLTYQEITTLEPLLRKWNGGQTIAQQATAASTVLKRSITVAQVFHARAAVGISGSTKHRWVLTMPERKRLDAMLQRLNHVVVFRGPKRMYLMSFDKAISMRGRFIKNRVWEKAPNGIPTEARLAHESPASR